MNPLTLQLTDSFKFWTYTFDGYLMDYRNTSLAIQMQQVPFITSVVVSVGSLVNSATTNYTLLITPIVPVNNSHAVVVQFPQDIVLPVNSSDYQCSSADINLIQSVNCTNLGGNLVQANLTLQQGVPGINPSQTFRI